MDQDGTWMAATVARRIGELSVSRLDQLERRELSLSLPSLLARRLLLLLPTSRSCSLRQKEEHN